MICAGVSVSYIIGVVVSWRALALIGELLVFDLCCNQNTICSLAHLCGDCRTNSLCCDHFRTLLRSRVSTMVGKKLLLFPLFYIVYGNVPQSDIDCNLYLIMNLPHHECRQRPENIKSLKLHYRNFVVKMLMYLMKQRKSRFLYPYANIHSEDML